MKILALPRYSKLAASSRHRMYQFHPLLKEAGFEIDYRPLLDDDYVRRLYDEKHVPFLDVARSYVSRVLTLARTRPYDLLWLQQEAFPWIPYSLDRIMSGTGIPVVLDMDDAFFHRYDEHNSALARGVMGTKIDNVMRQAALVVAGNKYLAERAGRAGARRVEIIPTVIDLNRYQVRTSQEGSPFTIGWIGSPKTARYLGMVKDVLKKVGGGENVRFIAIGGATGMDIGIPVDHRPWSDETEVSDLMEIDVGIMPLPDDPWERGKCGFKIVQYMACGKPAVASPVGVNSEIIKHGVDGFLAGTDQDWAEALSALQDDKSLREKMGRAGRNKIEKEYNTTAVAPRLAELFRGLINEPDSHVGKEGA